MNLKLLALGLIGLASGALGFAPQDDWKWQEDLDAALRLAKDQAKPLMIVFR